ncbi:MAG: bifunctional riboflavin kinase/FAD synthetase [Bacteroidaceae bacterium]|nr:bifunctional riboflavin kinase/FAD synthetase [Bacteroidaceae bacterium]
MRKGFALTIGFFDGVHQGHRYLLQQLEELAAANGLSAAAVTFDRHPRTVVQSDFVPSLLTTQEEKLALLSRAFSGKIIVLPFTQELSEMTAKEFMQNILREKLNAELLLMGYNHRFGHGGGNPEDYVTWGQETGIKVCLAKALAGEKVSSSRIRNLISLGEVKKANNLLGYPYFLTGKVTEGKQIGRQIGFPTANLTLPEQKLMPACGVYAVWVTMPDHSKRGGMLCIGHRPTVEQNGEISVEVHIFDFNGNLYGTSISIDFIEKLRDERHFDSLEELQKQLILDAALAQETICHSI